MWQIYTFRSPITGYEDNGSGNLNRNNHLVMYNRNQRKDGKQKEYKKVLFRLTEHTEPAQNSLLLQSKIAI